MWCAKTQCRVADVISVGIQESWQINYWCTQTSCSERELRDAVKAVGESGEHISS
jgi:hypothetical protein